MVRARADCRVSVLFVVLVPAAACLQVGVGTGTGADAGSAAPASTTSATGQGCSEDIATQVTLCAALGSCPGTTVDPAAFPNCGFRRGSGSLIDLECLCGDALCPIGVAATCTQAAMLLTQQTELAVCAQQAEGRCLSLTAPDAAVSTCDKACESECAGAPECIKLCGC